MTILELKKEYGELVFGRFFIERLNKFYHLNYQIIPNNDQFSDVDIYAAGENIETLNLQLKTGEPGREKFLGERRKHGSGWRLFTFNIEEFLSNTIKSNELKYTDRENLILVITERQEPVFDKEFAMCLYKKLPDSKFKGIYLVKLPALDQNHPYEGQIFAIKDMDGHHGEIF